MPRAIVAVVALSVALAAPLASGARSVAPSRAAADSVLLRARYHHGPWKTKLSLKLVKLRLTDISLCAIWNHEAGAAYDCDAVADRALPSGEMMRLEQSPILKALKRPDSPGWGMLGASVNASLGAVVSNVVTGNRIGTVRYRVTLRDRDGRVLATSNTFTLVWR